MSLEKAPHHRQLQPYFCRWGLRRREVDAPGGRRHTAHTRRQAHPLHGPARHERAPHPGHIPKRYGEKVVYINPLAKKVPGISIFCGKTKEEKELDIASLSSMLKSTAGDALGVRDRERHRWRRDRRRRVDGASDDGPRLYVHRAKARAGEDDREDGQPLAQRLHARV